MSLASLSRHWQTLEVVGKGKQPCVAPARYIYAVAISRKEFKRRVAAARMIRGNITQADFDAVGSAYGLDEQELSRAERGELDWTTVRRDAFAKLLHFPAWWFTDPVIGDLGWLPAQPAPVAEVAVRAIEQALEEVETALDDQDHREEPSVGDGG